MKYVTRYITRKLVNFTKKIACSTFGDIASLSSGPCERCVGHRVEELTAE